MYFEYSFHTLMMKVSQEVGVTWNPVVPNGNYVGGLWTKLCINSIWILIYGRFLNKSYAKTHLEHAEL